MLRNPTIKVDLHNIKRTKSYKYLGLVIDEGMTFHEHVKNITEKAKNPFHALNRTISRLYSGSKVSLSERYSKQQFCQWWPTEQSFSRKG